MVVGLEIFNVLEVVRCSREVVYTQVLGRESRSQWDRTDAWFDLHRTWELPDCARIAENDTDYDCGIVVTSSR